MHFLKKALLALCASAVMATPVPEGPEDAPNARDVYIKSIVWNGSGCQMGGTDGRGAPADTTYVLSSDRKTLTIIYSDYIAQTGPNTRASDQRKNCLINMSVNIPKDWQYSVSATTFHGFRQLGSSCQGYVKASYWFSGQTQTASEVLILNVQLLIN
jgi:hypothetical protein